MTFNEKLLSLRRKSGFSQEELAEKLNVSRQAVSRWEMGETMPDAKNLLELSDIFGVSIDSLLRDEKQTGEATAREKPQTVNNTYINPPSQAPLSSRILHVAHRALPPVSMGASGYLTKVSAPAMIIFWLVAVFTQFTVIAAQKNDLLTSSQKERKSFFDIATAVNIFISASSLVVFFAKIPIFNIFIYIVLLHIFAIFEFEATLFYAGKSPLLTELRLKFYRLNMWFFTPSLAALAAQTAVLFSLAQNIYLAFAAALTALFLICACFFTLLQRTLKNLT